MGRGLGPLQKRILIFMYKNPNNLNVRVSHSHNSTYRISRAILVRVDGKWDNYFNLRRLVQNVHHSLEALVERGLVVRIRKQYGRREWIWELTSNGWYTGKELIDLFEV